MSTTPKRPPKVYVANWAGHDVEDAKRFGELVYVTEGKPNVFDTDRLMLDLARVVEESTPDDYLVLAGMSFVATACALAMAAKNGRVNVLLWGVRDRRYLVRTFDMNRIRTLIEGGSNVAGTEAAR